MGGRRGATPTLTPPKDFGPLKRGGGGAGGEGLEGGSRAGSRLPQKGSENFVRFCIHIWIPYEILSILTRME